MTGQNGLGLTAGADGPAYLLSPLRGFRTPPTRSNSVKRHDVTGAGVPGRGDRLVALGGRLGPPTPAGAYGPAYLTAAPSGLSEPPARDYRLNPPLLGGFSLATPWESRS